MPALPAPERGVSEDRLHAAVAAGVLGSEERFRELLRSIVEVARAIFAAKASSILLLDEETTSSSSRLSSARARRTCSERVSPRAPASPAGCSPPGPRS